MMMLSLAGPAAFAAGDEGASRLAAGTGADGSGEVEFGDHGAVVGFVGGGDDPVAGDRARVPSRRPARRPPPQSAREALSDMRRLLGVLRSADEPERLPQPGLADLPALVDSARRAEAEVSLDLPAGDPDCPPASRWRRTGSCRNPCPMPGVMPPGPRSASRCMRKPGSFK
jgi:hypothetical protein